MKTVTLPWPPRDLSPNARVHWSKRAKAAKKYRADCYYCAKLEHASVAWFGEPIRLVVTFCPPAGRQQDRHDLDNCVASCKAGFDGLADALRVNDKVFQIVASIGTPVPGGGVHIEIYDA